MISEEFKQTTNKVCTYKDTIRHARTHTIFLSHILSWEVIWECTPAEGRRKTKDIAEKVNPKKSVDSNQEGIEGSSKITAL